MTARALPFLPPLAPEAFPWGVFASAAGLFHQAAGKRGRRAGEGAAAVIQQAAEPPGPPTSPADVDRFRRLLLPFQDDAYGFALHLCRDPSTVSEIIERMVAAADAATPRAQIEDEVLAFLRALEERGLVVARRPPS